MAKTNSFFRLQFARGRCLGLVVVICAQLTGLAGCGPAASDSAPGLDSQAAPPRSIGAGTLGNGQALEAGVTPEGDRSGQSYRPAADEPAPSGGKTDGNGQSPVPNIPVTNPEDFNSTGANARFPAAANGEAEEAEAPLDPSSEIMEGEASALQSTPAMALEQYWAKQQEEVKR